MKLEEAQRKLEVECGREPTVGEWAEAVDMSCRELQSSIRIVEDAERRWLAPTSVL